jgi:hypothetical protein
MLSGIAFHTGPYYVCSYESGSTSLTVFLIIVGGRITGMRDATVILQIAVGYEE